MEHAGPQEKRYLATGFRNVDSANAPKMTQCLKILDSLPSFQRYKDLILQEIDPRPGEIIADLGCGLGFDVRRMASFIGPQGCAIRVDASNALLRCARLESEHSSMVQFITADIHELPFESGYLHACKVDRTLQHVERPALVFREMFRTVRPGGVVVCAEPDWGTFTIDHDDRAMVRQIAEFWTESFRNPWIGRQLSNELHDAGFTDIKVQGMLLSAPSFEISDKVFDIIQTAVRFSEVTGNDGPRRL